VLAEVVVVAIWAALSVELVRSCSSVFCHTRNTIIGFLLWHLSHYDVAGAVVRFLKIKC